MNLRPRPLVAATLLLLLAAVTAACSSSGSGSGQAATPAGPATGAQAPTQAQATTVANPDAYTNPQLLAETAWLKDHLSDPSLAVVDLRKKESYDAGHVPGAVWYDANKLKDPDEKLYVIRDTLFAKYVGEIGIDTAKTVITYDDNAGLSATRFWWVLWYYGNDHGKVLNGGWQKWEKEGLAVSKETPRIEAVTFKTAINDQVICAADYVKKEAEKADANVMILDVRSTAEYTGADVRSAKGGHVPTAVNLDWTRSMTDNDPKVWKSARELRDQLAKAGIKPGAQVITYCQTGVRAAHSLFTLRLLGYDGSRLYDGSWQEWGNLKDTPVSR